MARRAVISGKGTGMKAQLARTIRAVGTDDFLPELVELARHSVAFENVIALLWRGAERPRVLLTRDEGSNVFRRLEKDYLAAAYQLDPFHHLHLSGELGPGIYRLMDIAPDHFFRSRYFKWYYGDLGITDEMTLFCPLEEGVTLTVSFGRAGGRRPAFSARDKERIRRSEQVFFALMEADWAAIRPARERAQTVRPMHEQLQAAMQERHGIGLSTRHAEVAVLILKGHSTESAALVLGISAQTVKVFRKQLYKRCGISSQAELFSLMLPLIEPLERQAGAAPR